MEIKNLGLEELSVSECKKANGGFWQFVALSLLGGLICDVVFDPAGVAYEFNRGWNGK